MIIITGASDGLGKELARLYRDSDIEVINISRRSCDYADINIVSDLSTEDGITMAAKSILELDGKITALINCAGVLSLEPLGRVSWSELDRVLRINTAAPILLTSLLMERLKTDKTDIVSINSTAGLKSYKGQPVYDTSKHALKGFTDNLRLELEDSSNRVIGVYPGMFDSDISQKIPNMTLGKSKHPVIPVKDLANLIKMTLELPKVMEVSDIIINRKVVKN